MIKDKFIQRWKGFKQRLFLPTDGASIAVFRIVFGIILFWEVIRYFQNGWIKRYYIDPIFHFSYFGFDWVKPLHGDLMYVYFVVLGLLALCVAMGICYRPSIILFFLGFSYLFLMEESRWLNHFYLIILISFLLIFIPAHRTFSVDAWLRPKLRSGVVPTWSLWLLRTQIGLIYFFGGIAKLNSDWLHGQPMTIWLGNQPDFPLIGALFRPPTLHAMGVLFSYGGLLLDLSFVQLILWQKTRPFAFVAALLFHLMNSQLFDIGIFPFMMIAANFLFLRPDWPRVILQKTLPPKSHEMLRANNTPIRANQRLILLCLSLYLAVQFLVPLRHFLYFGDPKWTQQGDRFSWRMKLLDIQGKVEFFVADPNQQELWVVDPAEFLSDWQVREMIQRPDMMLQFSHYLATVFQAQGHSQVEVRVQAMVSLNGRAPQLLIDPDVDLATQPRTLAGASWFLPLTEPLPEYA